MGNGRIQVKMAKKLIAHVRQKRMILGRASIARPLDWYGEIISRVRK